ncbi:MAG: HlyD family secretion protein [Gemmatimonadaceae bacterium]
MTRALAVPALLFVFATCDSPQPEREAAGTVELVETDISPLAAARVLRVVVDEGAPVRQGDTLVILSQSGLPPELESRRARLSMTEAELRDLRAGAQPAEIERARADLAAAMADAERARKDAERYKALLQSGSVAQAQYDALETAARVAAQRVVTAGETVRLLETGPRPERIRAAEGAVRQARAQLHALEATAADLVLVAPHDGVVLGRYTEPGEAVAAGTPLVSLGDPRKPWVRVFVAPARLEHLHVGDRAQVTIVGGGDRTYPATVVSLNTRAEFTPRVAMTEIERADLLFGVKLTVDDTTGRIKAGMPVSVRFSGDSAAAWRP